MLLALAVFCCASQASAQTVCPSWRGLKAGDIDQPFVEQRYLAGIEHPLVSSGRLLASGTHVSWHVMAPFDVLTQIDNGTVRQAVAGGALQPVSAGGIVESQIAKTIMSILQGHFDALQSVFTLTDETSKTDHDWRVVLEPVDPALSKLIGRIVVNGCEAISQVELVQHGGDHEVIRFGGAAP